MKRVLLDVPTKSWDMIVSNEGDAIHGVGLKEASGNFLCGTEESGLCQHNRSVGSDTPRKKSTMLSICEFPNAPTNVIGQIIVFPVPLRSQHFPFEPDAVQAALLDGKRHGAFPALNHAFVIRRVGSRQSQKFMQVYGKGNTPTIPSTTRAAHRL